MTLVDVYLEKPTFPLFVSIDTSFVGANKVFEGIKNPKLDLSTEEYKIIEGINVVRSVGMLRRDLLHSGIGQEIIPVEEYGNFWVYKTAPYPALLYLDGFEPLIGGSTSTTGISEHNITEWDVYKYYVENNPYQYPSVDPPRQAGPVESANNIFFSSIGTDSSRHVYIYDEDVIAKYISGEWDWDWFYTNATSTAFVDRIVNHEDKYTYYNRYEMRTFPTVVEIASKATYIDLLSGWVGDTRTIPNAPVIIPTTSQQITVGYYRENKLEPIKGLRSIDWMTYQCDLEAGVAYDLPITDCTLGTLNISDSAIKAQLIATPVSSSEYDYKYYFVEYLAELFVIWNEGLALTANSHVLRILGANNNCWNNRPDETLDVNVDLEHPMFAVDNARAYNWHVKPQSDGSYGDLIMDGPRTIESHAYLLELRKALQVQNYQVENLTSDPPLHYLDWYIKNSSGDKLDKVYKALGAELWGTNPDSSDVARVDNLGWRIKRLSEVLGIRVKTDGTIDGVLEKTVNRRLHADGSEANDLQDYNPNCFGKKGMLVRHVPNKFSENGTVSGGYRKIHDLPQLLAEIHEQANAAMGYQEGTAIEIQLDGKKYRYPNQLALMTELFVTTKQIATYSKGSFFSSVIAEQSIKEVISGLGLRTVDKYLEFIVAGKPAKLYYKGISASQSIRRKLSAIATNIGTVLGNII